MREFGHVLYLPGRGVPAGRFDLSKEAPAGLLPFVPPSVQLFPCVGPFLPFVPGGLYRLRGQGVNLVLDAVLNVAFAA